MAQLDLLDIVPGLDFPVSKEDLVRLAQEQGAGNEVIAVFQSLPARQFTSGDELDEALAMVR